jgi:hypothetical protein
VWVSACSLSFFPENKGSGPKRGAQRTTSAGGSCRIEDVKQEEHPKKKGEHAIEKKKKEGKKGAETRKKEDKESRMSEEASD